MPKKLLDDEERLIRGSNPPDREKTPFEREPVSWRDRDRKKDRSAHSSPDSQPRSVSSPQNRFLVEQQRKSDLEAAGSVFSNPARESLERKLLSATSDTLERLGNEYIQMYDYPVRFDVLARLVDHPKGEVVKAALEKIEPILAEQTSDRRQNLLQAVKLVSMMGRDPIARRAASSFIRRQTTPNVST